MIGSRSPQYLVFIANVSMAFILFYYYRGLTIGNIFTKYVMNSFLALIEMFSNIFKRNIFFTFLKSIFLLTDTNLVKLFFAFFF